MPSAIRILNKHILQAVINGLHHRTQLITISIPTIEYISWPTNKQISIYLDDRRIELGYKTVQEASTDHTLLTTLLTASGVEQVRWDMPIPDLMTEINMEKPNDNWLKPDTITVYKNNKQELK